MTVDLTEAYEQIDTLQWGHGRWAVDDVSACPRLLPRSLGFNGATAAGPWMTLTDAARYTVVAPLQWGHGRWAVDDAPTRLVGVAVDVASMGPRPLGRG